MSKWDQVAAQRPNCAQWCGVGARETKTNTFTHEIWNWSFSLFPLLDDILQVRDAKSLSSATRKLSEMCLSKSYAKLSENRFSEIQSEAKLRETSKIGQKFNSSFSITISVFLFHIRNKRSSNFSVRDFSVSLTLFETRIIRIFA